MEPLPEKQYLVERLVAKRKQKVRNVDDFYNQKMLNLLRQCFHNSATGFLI